jgi:hypothetical protein
MEIDEYARVEKDSETRMVHTINGLIRSMAADQGKKIMLLVTHRLGREAGNEVYQQNMRTTERGIPLEKRAAIDMTNVLRTLDDAANANGVTMYPMFPEGLETTVTDSTESDAVRNVDYQRLNNEMHAARDRGGDGRSDGSGNGHTKLIPRSATTSTRTIPLRIAFVTAVRTERAKSSSRPKIPADSATPRVGREFRPDAIGERVIAALFRIRRLRAFL